MSATLRRVFVVALFLGCTLLPLLWWSFHRDQSGSRTMDPEDVRQLLQQAVDQVASNPVEARDEVLRLLKTNGQDNDALNIVSATYEEESRAAKSVADEAAIRQKQVQQYQQLAEAIPRWPELLYRLASQRLVLQRLMPERMDQLETAVDDLRQVIELGETAGNESHVVSGHFQLGRTYKHEGDSLRNLGKTDAVADSYRKAIESFSTALRLDPTRIDAVGEIVLIHLANDDAPAAEQVVLENLQIVKKKSYRGKLWEMLGELLKQKENIEEAESCFENALDCNPRLMGSYLHTSSIWQQRGDYARAEQALKQSIHEEPGFLRGYLGLGNIYLNQERYGDARDMLEQMLLIPSPEAVLIGMLPSRSLYRNGLYYQGAATLAWIHLQLGDTGKAMEATEKALQYQPIEAHLMDTRGSIFLAQSDRQQAVQYFKQAIEAAGLPASHYHLAELYYSEGDLELARDHLSQAMASDQSFHDRSAAEDLLADVAAKISSEDSTQK